MLSATRATPSSRKKSNSVTFLTTILLGMGMIMIVLAFTLSTSLSAQASSLSQSKGTTSTPAQQKGDTSSASPQGTAIPVIEGFEGDNLSSSTFSSYVETCTASNCGWRTVSDKHHTGIHSAWVPDVASASDQQLNMNTPLLIPANATSVEINFWHSYAFETINTNYYDGGVLEVSTDYGSTWADTNINFISGGYNGTLHGTGNPLADRQGWGGQQATFTQVRASLLAYAGATILVRFREGTDNTGGSPGWWIDDIQLSIDSPALCTPYQWENEQSYPLSMAGGASVTHNGEIYIFGGRSSANSLLTTSYKFTPYYNSWSTIPPIPEARSGSAAVSDGTYIYILGGYNSVNDETNTLWRYDPEADTYTPLMPYNHPTQAHAAAILNGKIYRIGGYLNGTSVSTVEVYNISTNTWTDAASYPISTSGIEALTLNNYIYTIGGLSDPDSNKTYRYDPVTNTWDDAAIADAPATYSRYNPAGGFVNGRWVVAGGSQVYQGHSDDTVAWDPATNTWSTLPHMSQPRYAAASGVLGQSLYVIGGLSPSAITLSSAEYYTEIPCSPAPVTPTVTPSATATPPPGGSTPTVCPIQFTDVEQGNTFYSNIRCLSCRGIVTGYADGTFRPNNNITRGQLAKIVSNSAGFNEDQNTQMFEDVPLGSTFYLYIGRLASRGFMSGYACGGPSEQCGPTNLPYFRPNSNASRGQISKIVSNSAGYAEPQSSQLYEDVLPGTTFQQEISRLSTRGIINGYPCGGPGEPCGPANLPYFRPAGNATRGQTSKIVGNTFFPNCQTP